MDTHGLAESEITKLAERIESLDSRLILENDKPRSEKYAYY